MLQTKLRRKKEINKKKIICVVGTRPEAIKMAPIILELKSRNDVDCKVLATAQHRQMLDQVFGVFQIKPDIDLDIMKPNQKLTKLTSRLLLNLDKVFLEQRPDIVLSQGDTTTVMTTALTCFYHRIAFGHVEAGLRTWDISNPFPEEMNRVVSGKLSEWHFAPTEGSRQNLLKEGYDDSQIFVTGNTVIDALKIAITKKLDIGESLDKSKKLILVTAHRRENFGSPMREICRAILALVKKNQDIQILFPVHPNPNVQSVVYELLDGNKQIVLCKPLDYLPFVAAMQRAYFILSDSGGVQEEAPALGKPVLVLREETERPEAIDAGTAKLVGCDYDTIIKESQKLLNDQLYYKSMSLDESPYGDGHSAKRIVKVLLGK